MNALAQKIKVEIKNFTLFEKLFILCAMICGFCITSEYSITKPVSYSVFISAYKASYLPYAWLLTIPLNFLVVFFYNKFLPKIGCFKMVLATILSVGFINLAASYLLPIYPKLAIFHFAWKDIYVLLMFQHLWSMIHATIKIKQAKYLYGIIYAVGGLGSVIGSLLPAYLATKVGSEKLLCSSMFFYAVFGLSFKLALTLRKKISQSGESLDEIDLKSKSPKGGFSLVFNSRYLTYILLIVVFMQVSASLMDFQFNSFLEKIIPEKDLRTAYCGRLFGLIHTINIFFQAIGSFIIVHYVGLRKSHILIPLFFGINIIGFILFPFFRVITLCFATIKSFDYSIFGILKEMLYIPLDIDKKFRAKAVIDVFAYRSAKALSSIVILGVQSLLTITTTTVVSWALLAIFIVWMAMSVILFKKHDIAAKQI